jgi:hypothetical protein
MLLIPHVPAQQPRPAARQAPGGYLAKHPTHAFPSLPSAPGLPTFDLKKEKNKKLKK